MPHAKATTVALTVSFLSLMVTLVSLSAVLLVASTQGGGACESQMPNGSGGEQIAKPPQIGPASPAATASQPFGQASLVKPSPTTLSISAPKEIADYARATIEQSRCKDCQCTNINLVRAAIKPLTDADKQSQITDAWCFEIYYSKQVCKWEDMATTLSIRKVRGQLQAAEMGWGEFDQCLLSEP